MSVSKKLAALKMPKLVTKKTEPFWKGPEKDGISFSLLNRFLADRERFRLYVIEGLKAMDTFNHRIEYGNMWHLCEEAIAEDYSSRTWMLLLRNYCEGLVKKYRTQQEQVDHWYNVCKVQFDIYCDYWKNHSQPHIKAICQEQVFRIPYKLPSGRIVRLRGKIDMAGILNGMNLYIKENKSKGDIDETKIKRELSFDLQTMLYMTALHEVNRQSELVMKEPGYGLPGCSMRDLEQLTSHPIGGVIYNVVRRPLSGGKGTIVRHKPSKSNPQGETKEAYYNRLGEYISTEPHTYFMRWQVEINRRDVERFQDECLDPILEQLCDWYEWVAGAHIRGKNLWDNDVSFNGEPWGDGKTHASAIHWRTPYGIFNPITEGYETEYDSYMDYGNKTGLVEAKTLFPELE